VAEPPVQLDGGIVAGPQFGVETQDAAPLRVLAQLREQVDGEPVKSPEEFNRLVAKAKAQGAVSLALGRGGMTLVLSFPLGEG